MRQYFLALACALLVSGCATKSLEWQRHTEDEFPTRVNWIISQVGNVLDAKRGLRYGTWTVTSGEGGPYAAYQCPQDGICEINISNLQCEQSTGGRSSCELVLYKNAICELVIPEKRETLEIGCPIQVALKPKGKGETASPEEAKAAAAAAAAAAATAKGAQEAAGIAPAAPKKAPEAAVTAPATPKRPRSRRRSSYSAEGGPGDRTHHSCDRSEGSSLSRDHCRNSRTGEGPIRCGRLRARVTGRSDRTNPTDTGELEQRHLRRASCQSRSILRRQRMGTAGTHARMATIQNQCARC